MAWISSTINAWQGAGTPLRRDALTTAPLMVSTSEMCIRDRSSEVICLYSTQGYHAAEYYARPEIEPLVDFLLSKPMLRAGDAGCLGRLYQDLTHKDWFMTLLDLEDYIRVKERMLADYEDRTAWARRMLYNIANAGFFSSDRTIAEYNRDIWHLAVSYTHLIRPVLEENRGILGETAELSV